MSVFILGTLFSATALAGGENSSGNETTSKLLDNESSPKAVNKSISQPSTGNQALNASVNKSANKPAPEKESVTKNASKGSELPVSEQKFRVAPTVVLRPVNDVITENEDGLVELYIDNPSLNDVTLNVDARISVPAGIHVYGQGFAQTGAAGTVYGTFSVPPATSRTFYIDIKGDKPGTYTIHFSGLYWPEDNKDAYNPISLTHPFVVEQPSSNPETAPDFDTSANLNKNEGVNAEAEGSFSAPGFSVLVTIIGLLAVYGSYIRKRK